MITSARWRQAVLAFSLSAGMTSLAAADVIYRETFGRPETPTGNLSVQQWDWAQFSAGGAVHTGGNVNGADPGRPTDLANTASAGPNNDLTTGAYLRGWHYFDGGATAPGARALSMTTEYSFNPADYMNNLKFSWWQGNTSTTVGGLRVAIRQAGSWYATNQVFNSTAPVTGGGNFGTMPEAAGGAEPKEFFYSTTAANWLTLNFDGDFALGATPGTGTATASTTPISLGSAPSADLSGPITAFGLYRDTYQNNSRFDSFTIESSGPPPLPGDTDGDGIPGEYPDDFEPIRANLRKSVTSRSMGDLTGDRFVDFADFREWKAVHLAGGGSLAGVDFGSLTSVPEPSAAALALAAMLGLVGASLRRRTA